MASLTGQSPPDASSRFDPSSAPGKAGVSEVECALKRVIKLSTYVSCDNLVIPNFSFLSMPRPSYQVHSPGPFVGNVLFRDNSNDSHSSCDPPTSRLST